VGAVAHHGDPGADREDLFQPVRDEQDGRVLCLQGADHLEQPVHLGGRQRGGGLVHDDHPRVQRQGLADLDHLLVGDGQAAGGPRRVQRHAEALEDGGRLVVHGPPVDATVALGPGVGAERLAADEHVLRHRQVGEQRRLLVDHRDARRPGGGRAVQGDLLAADGQRPVVRLVHPGEDLDQGGLARPVLSEQRVHLARPQFHRPVDQRPHRAEGLGGMSEFEHGRRAGGVRLIAWAASCDVHRGAPPRASGSS
jgi:hypothetical protein